MHYAVRKNQNKQVVPAEELLNVEIRCLQRQRLRTLHDTYAILNANYQESEVGKEVCELRQKKHKYQQELKENQENIHRIKVDKKTIYREKDERTKNMILQILQANKEILDLQEVQANQFLKFEFLKSKSVRELFPRNLEEEFEKRSTIFTKRLPVSSGNVFVSKMSTSRFVSNANGLASTTTDTSLTKTNNEKVISSFQQDTVVIKSNRGSQVSLRRSSEVEIKHTSENSTPFCSNLTIRPTNFQKYDYLKSLEERKPTPEALSTLPSTNSSNNINTSQKYPQKNKVNVISVDVIKPADSSITDRFSRYLVQSPLPQVFTQINTSSEKGPLDMPSLNVDFDMGSAKQKKNEEQNSFNFDTGFYKTKNGDPEKPSESRPGPSKVCFDFNEKTSVEKPTPKAGSSNGSQNHSNVSSHSLNLDLAKGNFEDFAKGFNFSNDDPEIGFNFNDENLDSSFKMDFNEGADNSFCFDMDSTAKEGNDDFFHF